MPHDATVLGTLHQTQRRGAREENPAAETKGQKQVPDQNSTKRVRIQEQTARLRRVMNKKGAFCDPKGDSQRHPKKQAL